MTDQAVSTRIEWVREHCRLLRAISAEFRQTRPFDGLTIGTGIHLVPVPGDIDTVIAISYLDGKYPPAPH